MSHSSHSWSFRWLTTWDEVFATAFVAQWRGWMDRDPDAHVFFHPALVRAWTDTYRGLRRIEPRFCIARCSTNNEQRTTSDEQRTTSDEQRTTSDETVFLPLILDRGGWKDAWLRVLQPVGYNEFDYHDPIVAWEGGETAGDCTAGDCTAEAQRARRSEFWQAFRAELARRSAEFDLCLIPRIRRHAAPADARPVEAAPFIDVSKHPSCEAFMASRSGNLRQGLKRKRKRLAEQGDVTFRAYAPEETGEALAALAQFRKNHEIRWPRAYRAPGLFENLIKHALPAGLLHLSTIECGGSPVSRHFGFMHNKRFYWYIPAYDNRFSRFSPGLLHVAQLVEECYRLGATTFDFLRGEERYKYEWTDDRTALCRVEIANRGPASRVKSAARHFLHGAAGVVRH